MPESSQNQIQQPATVQITPPAPPGHIATAQYSPMTCYICGYPNHPASHCALNNNRQTRWWKFSISEKPKKLDEPQVPEKSNFSTFSNHDHDSDDLNNDSFEAENEFCAVILLEGEFLSYVNILFDNEIRRKALIDTGSCANAIPKSLLDSLESANLHLFIKLHYL